MIGLVSLRKYSVFRGASVTEMQLDRPQTARVRISSGGSVITCDSSQYRQFFSWPRLACVCAKVV